MKVFEFNAKTFVACVGLDGLNDKATVTEGAGLDKRQLRFLSKSEQTKMQKCT